jgi:hypothetical protein
MLVIDNKIFRIITGVLCPLLIGGLIYVLYRPMTITLFNWIENTLVIDLVVSTREVNKVTLLPWVVYSLPDALWAYSLTMFFLILWDYKIAKHNIHWFLLLGGIAFLPELGQIPGWIPGTFDIVDILLKIVFVVLALLQNKKVTFKNNFLYEKKNA